MREQDLCPQCHHPRHLKAHEKKGSEPDTFEYDGGCSVMVYLDASETSHEGYYHEHCDCDGGE